MGIDPFTVFFIISTAYSVQQGIAARKAQKAAEEAAKGQDVRVSNSAESIDVMYGTTGTSGTTVFVDTGSTLGTVPTYGPQGNFLPSNSADRIALPITGGSKNEIMVTQTVLSTGEIQNVEEMWVDDTKPDADEITGYLHSQWLYGQFNQHAGNFSSKLNSSAKFTDLSYVSNFYLLNREDPQFSGVPTPFYFVKGLKVRSVVRAGSGGNFTYSLSTTKSFTANAALILLDYLTGENYGLNWNVSDDIDLESFYKASQICGQVVQGTGSIFESTEANTVYPYIGTEILYDENGTEVVIPDGTDYDTVVTDYMDIASTDGGGFNPGVQGYINSSYLVRYEFNGSLSTGANHSDNIGSILNVIPGVEFFRSPKGKWKLVVPDSLTTAGQQSVATLTPDDFVSDIAITFPDTASRLNQIDIKFANANKDYADDNVITPPTDSVIHASYKANDNNVELVENMTVVGVNNQYHAKSIAGNLVRQSRNPIFSFRLRPVGFLYEPGDILEIQDDLAGIGFKDDPLNPRARQYVRVIETKVKTNLQVEITAVHFDKDDYGWELFAYTPVDTRNFFDRVVGAPQNLALSTDADARVNSLTWAPNANEDISVQQYVLEAIRLVEDVNGDYVLPATDAEWETITTVLSSTFSFEHVLGNNASRFGYKIRAKTIDNRLSEYSNIVYAGSTLAANTSEADANAANASVSVILDSFKVANLVPDYSGELAGSQGYFLEGSGWDTENGNWEIQGTGTPAPYHGDYLLKCTNVGEVDTFNNIIKVPVNFKSGDKFTAGIWVYQTIADSTFKLSGSHWTYTGDAVNTTSNQWVFLTGQYTAGQDGTALYLQKRGGGDEEVTNGDFSNGTTGWSNAYQSTLSVVNGSLRTTSTNNNPYATQQVVVESGNEYVISFDTGARTSGSSTVFFGSVSGLSVNDLGSFGLEPNNSYSFNVTTTTDLLNIQLVGSSMSVGDYFDVDNVSVKKIGDTWIDSAIIVRGHTNLELVEPDDTVATNRVLSQIALKESRAIAHQTDNIIGKGQFEDNKIGNWQTPFEVVNVPSTHPLGHTKCAKQTQRTNYYYEYYSPSVAVEPHVFLRGNLHERKLRFTGYVYPDAIYDAKVGIRTINSTGSNTFASVLVADANEGDWVPFDVVLTINDADGVEFAPQLITEAVSGTTGLATYWSDLKLVDISESEFALSTAQSAAAVAAAAATAATNAQNTADLAQTSQEVLAAIAADTTVIDGARITTGTVAAARISISGLNISDLTNDSGFTNDDQANIAATAASNAAAAAVNAQSAADNAQDFAEVVSANASGSVNGNLIGKGVFEDGQKSTWSSTTAVATLTTAESTAHPLTRTKALRLTSSNGLFYRDTDLNWFSGYLHGRTLRATGYVYNKSTHDARIGIRTRNSVGGTNVNKTEKIADANGTGWFSFDVEIEVSDSDSIDFLPLIRLDGTAGGNTMDLLVTDLQLVDITDAAANAAAATIIASDLNTLDGLVTTAQADITAAQNDATQALLDAATAQSAADGKIESFYQQSAPTSASEGDFWIDTDDDNKLYIYNSSAWVLARDAGIAQAIVDAAGAQNTADGKITTFYNNTAPATGANEGDLWVDTDDGNKLYRFTSSSWVSIRDDSIESLISASNLKNLVIDSTFTLAGEKGDFLTDNLVAEWDEQNGRWEVDNSSTSPVARTGDTLIKLTTAGKAGNNSKLYTVQVDVSSGDKITVGLWVYNTTGSNYNFKLAEQGGWAHAQSNTQNAWQFIFATGTATADYSELTLAGRTIVTSGDIFVDQVMIVKGEYDLSEIIPNDELATAQYLIDTTSILAETKITSFYQASAPTGMTANDVGDLWIDTNDRNKLYRYSGTTWVETADTGIASAISDASAAQTTANSKIKTFLQTSAPTTGLTLGDLWLDTDDGNKAYRWNLTSWESVQDAGIATAIADAADAQTTADGKINSYYQTTAPTGMVAGDVGDLWADTDDGNKLYRYSGSAWVEIADTGIATAISNAATAQGTADGKVRTFYQDAEPTGMVSDDIGDLWIDTNDDNKLYRYSGANWVDARDAGIAAAITDAANAQSTADGKVRTFFQNDEPTGMAASDAGDIWIDTNDDNKMYRYSGAAFVLARDSGIGTAIANAATAQGTADGKVNTFYQDSEPTGMTTNDVGDLWVDTDDNNQLYRYSGSAWVNVRDNGIVTALDIVGLQNLVPDSDFERAGVYGGFLPNSNFNLDSSWELETSGTSPAAHSGSTVAKITSAGKADSNASLVRVYTDVKIGDKITIGLWVYNTTGSDANFKLDNQGGWATATSSTQGAWHFVQGTGTATADYTFLTLGRRPLSSTGDIWVDQVMIVKGEYDLTEFNVRDDVAYDRYKADQNLLSAAAAQATADGKITTFYQNGMPSSASLDLILNTEIKDNDEDNWVTQNASLADRTDNVLGGFDGVDIGGTSVSYGRVQTKSGLLNVTSGTDYTIVWHYKYGTSANARFEARYGGSSGACIVAGSSGNLSVTSESAGDFELISDEVVSGDIRKVVIKWTPDGTSTSAQIGMGPNTTTVGETIIGYSGQIVQGSIEPPLVLLTGAAINGNSEEGDIWVDTNDGNKMYIHNGLYWELARDNGIATAISNAATAQGTADGKVDTYYSSTEPTGLTANDIGDLWFDSSDKNKLYRYNGTAFVSARDTDIGLALSNAASAQSAADGKISSFYQNDAPVTSSASEGDFWIDTDDNNKLYVLNSSAWVLARDSGIATAISDAAGAQSTADGKITSFFSASEPTGLDATDAGDLWVDTDDDNNLYRYNGTDWVSIRDATIADAATAASDAASAASDAQDAADAAALLAATKQTAAEVTAAIAADTTAINGSRITTGTIALNKLTAVPVVPGDLEATGSTTIDGGRITTGFVGADRIEAGSLTLSKMENVTSNSSVSLNENGMRVTDAGGNVRVKIGNLALL